MCASAEVARLKEQTAGCVVSSSVYRKSSTRLFLLSARVSLDHDSAMTNRRGYISPGSLCEDAAVYRALVSWIVRSDD